MKCEFCGGNLSLEDKYCPHCGQINKHSQEHIREMGHFRKRFESTQNRVYGVTHAYTQLTVRIALICILIVLIILAVMLGTNAYSVMRDIRERNSNRKFDEYSEVMDSYLEKGEFAEFHYFCESNQIENAYSVMRDIRERNSNRKFDEYSEVMDSYLEKGEFAEFHYFCESNQIDWFESPYEAYAPVISAARDYSYIVDGIADMVCKEEEEEWEPKFLGSVVFSFYDRLNPENWSWYEGADSEKNRKALEKMVNQVEGLLITYCGLTREQAENLSELNEARITVLLEEAMANEAERK